MVSQQTFSFQQQMNIVKNSKLFFPLSVEHCYAVS